MNERFIKIGLESHMLNYVDNETPRHYFLSAHANEEDLRKFAELIVKECANFIKNTDSDPDIGEEDAQAILDHFGVKE